MTDLELVPEYRFDPKRKWRFDFADPVSKVAVEIEGGVYQNGRHNRGGGFIQDCEKYNTATAQGWRVFRLPSKLITLHWALIIMGAIINTEAQEPRE